ncbi:MAG TPA: hypothetical protein VEJ00_11405 [Candidatus Acidoferrales bacterium]|nr:hypothetical protein [Candidatus Acidoferrales bacterium]
MFLRFVTGEVHEESHQALGVFQAAYRLRAAGLLSDEEEDHLEEIREWFNENLEKPSRFTSAKPPYYRKGQNGISWSKDSAHEHIRRIREMVAFLKRHDVSVRMIKSSRPGYIVYEDAHQVVAVPFADSKL